MAVFWAGILPEAGRGIKPGSGDCPAGKNRGTLKPRDIEAADVTGLRMQSPPTLGWRLRAQAMLTSLSSKT
jgi:hypothetical protein